MPATKKRLPQAKAVAGALTVVLMKDKPCKGSVRYALPDSTPPDQKFKAPVTNVYVERAFLNGEPNEVEVTVAALSTKSATAPGAVLLMRDTEHKGSVRYTLPAENPTAPITNAYVSRGAFLDGMPDGVIIKVVTR